MAKEKACKTCKRIYEGDECPNCGKKDTSDTFKGRIEILNPEKSELANHLKINKNGLYAIKL
jgi:DNA-directed RNA polymerase subunit E"